MPDVLDRIEWSDRGEGPAVLLVPGSFGTAAGWRPVIEAMGSRNRFVTTSLLGYGATVERRPLGHNSMLEQVAILDAIIDRIGAPVHIVGHSFGGLAVLAHAIHGTHKARSLSLVEANPLGILKTVGDTAHYAMFEALIARYFAAFEIGEADAARHVIDFYGGDRTFDAFPPKVRDYVIKTTGANIRDWTSGTPFAPSLDAYRSIIAPTLVVRGGNGHPAMQRIAEILAATLPNAALHSVEGGSHFLPATHAGELASLVAAHIASVG